jgi:hypothetical protein
MYNRIYAKAAIACPSTSSGQTAAWYFSSFVGYFSPCGAKNNLQRVKSIAASTGRPDDDGADY